MEEASDVSVGLLVGVLGLVGLVLASGALDNEIFVFGLSLAGFAAVFGLGLIRRYFDRQEHRAAAILNGTVTPAVIVSMASLSAAVQAPEQAQATGRDGAMLVGAERP